MHQSTQLKICLRRFNAVSYENQSLLISILEKITSIKKLLFFYFK